jgi:phage shock protein PspC (stress-responsive transcriptional regulator)
MDADSTNPVTDTRSETPSQPGTAGLTRSADDRMIAGVAGGIARYLSIDATLIRIAFAVLTIVGGAGIPIYAAAWLLIPEEGHEHSIAASLLGSRPTQAL